MSSKARAKTIRESEVYRVQLPALHEAQRRVVAEAKRFNCVCCGRRWGKSTLGVDRLTHPALGGKPVAWFAPTNKSLAESWALAILTLKSITIRKQEDKHVLDLVSGGKVEMWSLEDPDSCRGRKYARVVIDEAAHVKDLKYAWQQVIRPALTDMSGDAWFMSTPKGINYFHELFGRGNDPLRASWASWQMPSTSNPFLPAGEIEEARGDLSESAFSQEYLAQFVNWEGAAFRNVMECATAERQAGPIEGHEYAFGVDWGRKVDATAVAIVDLTIRACVTLERWAGVPYPVQQDRLKVLNERWQPKTIIGEENSMGGPIVEALQRAGLPVKAFNTNNASKAAAIEALGLAFERCDIAIIPDPVLLSELQAYQAVRLPSGMTRYEAPAGLHDDTVMALAMAYEAIGKAKKLGRIVIGGLVRPSAWGNMAGR